MEPTLKVLNDLESAGAISRYAIGGAVAAIFYMEPFLTFDLDVFVVLPGGRGQLLSLDSIFQALRVRGYTAEGEFVQIEGVPVQFLPAYNALIEEALADAPEKAYESTKTRVLGPEYLLAIMVQTGRSKDRQRFGAFLNQAIFDSSRLEGILRRYDLVEKFEEWKREA